MMYKTLLISLISTLFIGCTSKGLLTDFKANELEARAVQHTKKADVTYENEQKVLMWATYLNNIKLKEFDIKEETFLVSLYFVNSKSQDIEKNGYSFTLNEKEIKENDEIIVEEGKKPIKIQEIQRENPKYKTLLDQKPWGKHYLVTFEHMKRVYDLTLKLSNPDTSSAQLKFQK